MDALRKVIRAREDAGAPLGAKRRRMDVEGGKNAGVEARDAADRIDDTPHRPAPAPEAALDGHMPHEIAQQTDLDDVVDAMEAELRARRQERARGAAAREAALRASVALRRQRRRELRAAV